MGLDETPPSGSDVSGELDPIAATAWIFLEAFVDARWHGFRDLDGIPWDAAIVLLEQMVDRLDRDLPITDPRLKRYRVTLPSQ